MSHQGYYLLSKYEILQCGDVEKLIIHRKSNDDTIQYYVHIEETFDVITRAYIATGHGGRDRMVKELGKKYANVTREYTELLSRCALTVSIKVLYRGQSLWLPTDLPSWSSRY
jgi:hypothetical protein